MQAHKIEKTVETCQPKKRKNGDRCGRFPTGMKDASCAAVTVEKKKRKSSVAHQQGKTAKKRSGRGAGPENGRTGVAGDELAPLRV